MISTNVIPEYQRMGVGLVLMTAGAHGRQVGPGRGRVLLGAGIQLALPRQPRKGRSEDHQDLSALRSGRTGGEGQGAGRGRGYHRKPAGRGGPIYPRRLRLGPLEIREVLNRRDLERFINFPGALRRRPALGRRRCGSRSRSFSIVANILFTCTAMPPVPRPAGRHAGGPNPRQRRSQLQPAGGENTGMFGMFESSDDQPTAHALFQAAADWLRNRGRNKILGPIDYSLNYPCGLLVEGFDTPPRVMMNHHRRYYAGLLESWGLRRTTTYTPGGSWIPTIWSRSGDRAERSRRGNITVRPFRTKRFRGRGSPLPRDLQHRDGRTTGVRQTDRGRIPVHGPATFAAG